VADFELKDEPAFVEAKPISKFCMEKFLRHEVDKVSVLYTHFINTISQRAVVQTLLRLVVLICRKAKQPKLKVKVRSNDRLPVRAQREVVLDSMLPY